MMWRLLAMVGLFWGFMQVTYADDASEECRWCAKEEVEQMNLWLNVRHYALAALNQLKEA